MQHLKEKNMVLVTICSFYPLTVELAEKKKLSKLNKYVK